MEINDATKITKEGWMIPSWDSHIGHWIEESGELCHDKFLPAFFANKMMEGNVVIDAGGFVGDHTIAYSNAVGKVGAVVAVEAGSFAYKCLVHNANLFREKNVMVIQAAIGELMGSPTKHHDSPNLGASTVETIEEDKQVVGETYLQTITIDYIRAQLGKKIDFIKLDIEGYEVKALIGAANTLRDDKPKMMIEVNSGALEKQGDSVKDLLLVLQSFGYLYEIIQPDCKMGDPQFDIYCKPPVDLATPSGKKLYLPEEKKIILN